MNKFHFLLISLAASKRNYWARVPTILMPPTFPIASLNLSPNLTNFFLHSLFIVYFLKIDMEDIQENLASYFTGQDRCVLHVKFEK